MEDGPGATHFSPEQTGLNRPGSGLVQGTGRGRESGFQLADAKIDIIHTFARTRLQIGSLERLEPGDGAAVCPPARVSAARRYARCRMVEATPRGPGLSAVEGWELRMIEPDVDRTMRAVSFPCARSALDYNSSS